ncbi:MAG: hypothetical protein A3G75_10505 [Verrucomicrobia bacterium RIFCSPLOWO2_12_FULL_64_8]|nr:MAG: hypothetical protein A3G75_10505 [Verrucomicrobia bacterium RIFCSPLOWO2_12_FULL_64_8]
MIAGAQESLRGKFFVAEVTGAVTFIAEGRAFELHKGDILPAQGARVETGPASTVALVFSNGSSVFVDERTNLEIRKFEQLPFSPGTDTTIVEPSISQTVGSITVGRMVLSTNDLASGTSMFYDTPHARVKIRGKQVIIEVREADTRVVVPVGDVTVFARDAATTDAGRLVTDGQMALVAFPSRGDGAGATGLERMASIQVLALPKDVLDLFLPKIGLSERAQKMVVFETAGDKSAAGAGSTGGGDIVAKAVLPAELPVPLTVSPSTLRTGR